MIAAGVSAWVLLQSGLSGSNFLFLGILAAFTFVFALVRYNYVTPLNRWEPYVLAGLRVLQVAAFMAPISIANAMVEAVQGQWWLLVVASALLAGFTAAVFIFVSRLARKIEPRLQRLADIEQQSFKAQARS